MKRAEDGPFRVRPSKLKPINPSTVSYRKQSTGGGISSHIIAAILTASKLTGIQLCLIRAYCTYLKVFTKLGTTKLCL